MLSHSGVKIGEYFHEILPFIKGNFKNYGTILESLTLLSSIDLSIV